MTRHKDAFMRRQRLLHALIGQIGKIAQGFRCRCKPSHVPPGDAQHFGSADMPQLLIQIFDRALG